MDVRQNNSLPWSHHVSRNNMFQAHVHHQFGRNIACPTTYVPVADLGVLAKVSNGTGAVSVDIEVLVLEAES